MNTVVKLHHVSIPIPPGGIQRARAFFGDALGLEEKPLPAVLDPSEIVWYRLGDGDHELHLFTEEGDWRSPGLHLCIEVHDVAGWRESLMASDVKIEETSAIVNRPRFFIYDPFGNRIEITQIEGEYS